MPISKNGKAYFSKKQLQDARSYSALDYAKRKGYDLVQQGNRFILRDHDSMVFLLDGSWHWNSHGLHGRALDLLINYEGYSVAEAVLVLTESSTVPRTEAPKPEAVDESDRELQLPPKARDCRRLFAYLCNTRGLNPKIVKDLVHSGRLYESITHYMTPGGEWKEAHNAVFLGLDTEGKPRSAFQRGLNSYKSYKREALGSNKDFPFCIPGESESVAVAVFEAAIDAISHATIARINHLNYQSIERIALGGIGGKPLAIYLRNHPEKKEIHFCLDNDVAGEEGAARLEKFLYAAGFIPQNGYRTIYEKVPWGKDWNEYLVSLQHGVNASPK